jgi:transcription elongation factor GreA
LRKAEMAGRVYLTREGYQKLEEELGELKGKRQRELASALERARHRGDLSENAEYDAARDAMTLLRARIARLEDILSRAAVLEHEQLPEGEVVIGTKVQLLDMATGERVRYQLVAEAESDLDAGKISTTSPIGRGLLGKHADDVAEITVPRGIITYRVLEVSR